MKYSSKVYQFMRGRYGIDSLYRFLFIMYCILVIINIFISSRFIEIIELLLFFFSFYRVFSKNIRERRKEEECYLKIKNSIISFFIRKKKSIEMKKYYVYRKCRNCKTVLRLPLPKTRGIHTVKCPKCHKKMKVLTLRKERVEVIRKKGKL